MPRHSCHTERLSSKGPTRPAAAGRRRLRTRLATAAALVLAVTLGAGGKDALALDHADWVVVKKSERRLLLLHEGQTVREYRIALGGNPRGHKLGAGDQRTPVGDYQLDWRNPYSNYYKSIHVSYPNERDRRLAQQIGTDPGGMIMIHGLPNAVRSEAIKAKFTRQDWTNGCIAVQDRDMDEIWQMVKDGTPIRIEE